MLLNLTDLSSEPLQQQIIRQVRAKILTSSLAAGDGLPSIRALSREQRISVITVKRAYENLEVEGLIHSRRGKGFFVSELLKVKKKSIAKQRLKENIVPSITAALAEGLTSEDVGETVTLILNNSGNNFKGTGV